MKNENPSSSGGGRSQPPDILDRTFRFAVEIIGLCQRLDERPGVGRVLMSQILRAGTSVPSNVEEAQAAQSKADFISKMSIALKEARETHLRLRLLAVANLLVSAETLPLIRVADEIRRILGKIIVSSKRGGARGG